MSINVGAHTHAGALFGASSVTSGAITTQATGSTFFIGVGVYSSANTITIADNKSNSFPQVGTNASFAPDNQLQLAIFLCVNGSGGAGHTFTANLSPNSAVGLWVVEITGGALSGILDQNPAANSSTTDPYTSSVTGTLSQPNELLISQTLTYTSADGEVLNWGNSFTPLDAEGHGSDSVTGGTAYRIVSSATTYQSSFSASGGVTSGALTGIYSFKELGAGLISRTTQMSSRNALGSRSILAA